MNVCLYVHPFVVPSRSCQPMNWFNFYYLSCNSFQAIPSLPPSPSPYIFIDIDINDGEITAYDASHDNGNFKINIDGLELNSKISFPLLKKKDFLNKNKKDTDIYINVISMYYVVCILKTWI